MHPVVTVSGGRNMWINAQEKTKTLLSDAGAQVVGNIALVDRHNNYLSLVTILLWMFSGRKERRRGFLPKPGVSDQDISHAAVFGRIVGEQLEGRRLGRIAAEAAATRRSRGQIPTDVYRTQGRPAFARSGQR